MRKSIFHLYLYGLFKRNANGMNLNISMINSVSKLFSRLPKKYFCIVIREMIDCNLLERIDRDNYRLLPITSKCLHDSIGNPLW